MSQDSIDIEIVTLMPTATIQDCGFKCLFRFVALLVFGVGYVINVNSLYFDLSKTCLNSLIACSGSVWQSTYAVTLLGVLVL